jgi:hypothetical protein
MKRFSPTFISVLLLIAFAFIFYFPLIFQQKMYTAQDWGRGDLTHFNYPLHHIYGNALKQFSLPFWTDEIYSGFQLGAEGQVGMFYLPNLILFSVLPNYTAYAFSFLVISLFASIGMYAFCRMLNLSHTSSLFAGITFAYSMFFAGHFVHLNMVQAFSLVPWFFVLAEYGIRRNFAWYIFLGLSLLQVQMFFTGHPQIALYTASILLLYVFFRSRKENRIRNTFITGGAITCGAIMAMVQLLPTWELSKVSPSSELESAASSMLQFPYTFRDLLYFFLPSPFGNPADNTYTILLRDGIYWENNTFSGILAAICVLTLLFRKPEKELRIFWIFLAVMLIFATGWIYIFSYLPPYSLFRLPQRALILSLFFFSVISAYGFTYLMGKLQKYGQLPIVVAVLVIVLQFANLWWVANYYNNPIAKDDWLRLPPSAVYLKNQEGRMYAIGGVKLWEKVYSRVAHGWSGNGGKDLIATKGILDPNRNATYGDIPSLDGYAKLVPLRTLAYISLIRKGINEDGATIMVSSSSAKLLGAGNVKTLVTAKPVSGSLLIEKAAFTDRQISTTFHVYDNPYYQPFIRSASRLAALPQTGNVEADNLISDGSDWQRTVYGEESGIKKFSSDVSLHLQKRTPQEIRFTVNSRLEPAFIVVTQSYDQNWKGFIDGKETKIRPININSQGIIVPAGQHTVILKYIPEWFIKGGYISLAGIIFTAFICYLIAKYQLFFERV